ncbi:MULTISPECIES: 5-formyltetrahydrofolate cyclo-ligase [Brevibacterium]|uniref:5-formyltetrahydrofolate cyclo-ligase n=1 Tax=Brevibacterium TaxID=1696 RepID=UPI001FE79250|nr:MULTISPECIES: 5-formyltetrahydrofolate cyclo-ligase [Brevibacterium]
MQGNISKDRLRTEVRARRAARAGGESAAGSPPGEEVPLSGGEGVPSGGDGPLPGGNSVAEAAWRFASSAVSGQGPPALLAYAALRGEPSLDSCIDRFLAAGATVYLPVVTRVGEALRFGAVTGSMESLEPRGKWGIREPEAQLSATELLSAEVGLDLIFVPALGFGADGARLGNGGGFYDRTFGPLGEVPLGEVSPGAEPRGPALGGVCFDDEIGLPGLRVEPWDLRITQAVTESGLHRFG